MNKLDIFCVIYDKNSTKNTPEREYNIEPQTLFKYLSDKEIMIKDTEVIKTIPRPGVETLAALNGGYSFFNDVFLPSIKKLFKK